MPNCVAGFFYYILMKNNDYDIVIAGAGASGLTLLWYILNSEHLENLRILLLDQSLKPDNSKTWCFWNKGPFPLAKLVYHSWKKLEVRTSENRFAESLNQYKYQCIRSIDYTKEILYLARKSSRVDLVETSIQEFDFKSEKALTITDDGTYSSELVFQSVKKPKDYHRSKADNVLLQHFTGWEIETSEELFNPERAIFMDFDVPQQNGVTFMYLLPYQKTRALVEYTIFSESLLPADVYEKELKRYLAQKYDLNEESFKILRKEKGVIPMEDRKYNQWYCQNVMNIGIIGGFAKPSSGYAFMRIHEQCREIVNALENNFALPDRPVSSYRFRVYDMMLLYLLKHEPDISLKIFHDFFRKNSFNTILKFLDEKTNFSQEVTIFSKVPYIPFFKSIYKMKHRIFTGA